jgi:hypothetical protein
VNRCVCRRRESLRLSSCGSLCSPGRRGPGCGSASTIRLWQNTPSPTACVLWVALGDPRDYHCGEAYRKAMGLNLKERSSGKHKSRLKITKRGPSTVRRWLYFAAMRATQDPNVRRWYEAMKARDGDRGKGALIGVARRLALALYGVAVRDEPFEAWRLFPTGGRDSSSAPDAARATGGRGSSSAPDAARADKPPMAPHPSNQV